MHSVRVDLHGDIYVVIHHKGNMIFTAKGLQFFRLLKEGLIVQFLFPKLHEGHAPVKALLYDLIQAPPVQPVTVGDSIQKQILLIALHILPPCRVSPHPC